MTGEKLRFGKCVLERQLGKGASAEVYLAKHTSLGIHVAVKILREEFTVERPDYAKRFLREARTAARLQHPNLIRVIDCGVHHGRYYMVMDYVEGTNCLKKIKESGPIGWEESTSIIRQAAAGLAYAAEQGMVHRDVKPSNIMIDRTGKARVTDLGLAKMELDELADLTRDSVAMGTPYYISPEQLKSTHAVDFRADIYSLGITYYHLVCGQVPFDSSSIGEIVAAHLQEEMPSPQQAVPELPDGVSGIILKMTVKSRDDRYQSYDDLIADLDRVLAGEPVSEAARKMTSTVHAEFVSDLEFGDTLESEDIAAEEQNEDAISAPEASCAEKDKTRPAGDEELGFSLAADLLPAPTELEWPSIDPIPISAPLKQTRRRRWPLVVVLVGAVLFVALILVLVVVLSGRPA